MKLLTRVGLGGVVLAATMVTTPAIASANPIADFFCNTGSAQFCPPPPPPPVLPPPVVTPPPPPPSGGPAPQAAPAPAPQGAFEYKNCTEARDAGAAPVYRDEYGYGRHLDRDDDGVGCE